MHPFREFTSDPSASSPPQLICLRPRRRRTSAAIGCSTPVEARTERRFELSPDGKTLTVEFTNYSGSGKPQKLVFNKQ